MCLRFCSRDVEVDSRSACFPAILTPAVRSYRFSLDILCFAIVDRNALFGSEDIKDNGFRGAALALCAVAPLRIFGDEEFYDHSALALLEPNKCALFGNVLELRDGNSGGKYNAQSADAQFKVAQSPANVAFFGSAK